MSESTVKISQVCGIRHGGCCVACGMPELQIREARGTGQRTGRGCPMSGWREHQANLAYPKCRLTLRVEQSEPPTNDGLLITLVAVSIVGVPALQMVLPILQPRCNGLITRLGPFRLD